MADSVATEFAGRLRLAVVSQCRVLKWPVIETGEKLK
jgi:hypothetical protein